MAKHFPAVVMVVEAVGTRALRLEDHRLTVSATAATAVAAVDIRPHLLANHLLTTVATAVEEVDINSPLETEVPMGHPNTTSMSSNRNFKENTRSACMITLPQNTEDMVDGEVDTRPLRESMNRLRIDQTDVYVYEYFVLIWEYGIGCKKYRELAGVVRTTTRCTIIWWKGSGIVSCTLRLWLWMKSC